MVNLLNNSELIRGKCHYARISVSSRISFLEAIRKMLFYTKQSEEAIVRGKILRSVDNIQI